jgi:hypothetical protein
MTLSPDVLHADTVAKHRQATIQQKCFMWDYREDKLMLETLKMMSETSTMETKHIAIIASLVGIGVLAGAAVGSVVSLARSEGVPDVSMTENAGIARNVMFTNKPSCVVTVEVARVDAALNEELDQLRMNVSKLQAQLSQKEAEIAQYQNASTNERPRRGARVGFKERLDKMKEDEPEQYKDMMSRIDTARESVRSAFAEKAFFLKDRDTSQMNEEELASYTNMVGLLNKTWGLTEKMGDMEMEPGERWATMGAMRGSMQELTPLMEEQRTQEFKAVGTSLGYEDKEAGELAEYLDGVVEATTMNNVFKGVRNLWRPGSRSGNRSTPSGTPPTATVQ